MTCIPIEWYYPSAAGGPVPCRWLVYGWQTSASDDDGPIVVVAVGE
jgi:hypothetical protein